MLGKRVLVTGLALVLLAGIAAAQDTYYPPGDANGQYGTFDWFAVNAWQSANLTTDPNFPYLFTWSAFWNGQNQVHENHMYYEPALGFTTMTSATALCPRVVMSLWGVGRWFWDHYDDVRVDDMNVSNGTNCDGGWNPIDINREGYGYMTMDDTDYDGEAIEFGRKTPPPFQPDPADPNNTGDPNTWTKPYPARFYADGGMMVFKGATNLAYNKEDGYNNNHFFIRIGRGSSSDTWPGNESNGGRFCHFVLEGSSVNVTCGDGGDADPNTGGNLFLKAAPVLEYRIDAGGVSTLVANGSANLEPGCNIKMKFLGAPPAGLTTYDLIQTGVWGTSYGPANTIPNVNPNSDNPGMWSYAIVGNKLVATYNPVGANVVNVEVFHNNSFYDGNNAAANASDDNAIDTSKSALLPGGASAIANVVANKAGINGIMVDIAGLAGVVTAADFTITRSGVSNGGAIGDYGASAAPTTVATRAGAGKFGSDRVTLIFPDSAADNSKWLRITVAANANTGLGAPYVFLYGNAIGETDAGDGSFAVDAADRLNIRDNPHTFVNPAPVTDEHDLDRDKFVDAGDRLICRDNSTSFLTDLQVINPAP